MRNEKISIIVPVYKAEKFIRKNLEKMKKDISTYFPNYEIIAVIDGYNDRSYQEAKKVKGIKVLGYKQNQGKGYALKYGFVHSTGEYVTFIDCDMDIDPLQLRNLLPYTSTADIIVGSKRHPFSKLEYPLIRRILSKGFFFYSWVLLGVKLRDTQSGFKLMKREVLDVVMPLILVKRYAFDLELCFLAQEHGFRMVEAPIHVDQQLKSSTITPRAVWGMFLDVLAIRYRYSVKHYYQKKFWELRFKEK
ncbi:MAG TPA: glycosyltransferase family 2 protein [Candidatus Paceibacterota bacterium]|nr:glycosyltransferase family 2 protein [Candidatus Paceibacterota bacterium]